MKIKQQKKRPIINDVADATIVANLAPSPLPAPSSFATLTLQCFQNKGFKLIQLIFQNNYKNKY